MKTGGKWDRNDRNKIFIATNPCNFGRGILCDNALVPADDIVSDANKEGVESWVTGGGSLLIDSGIFTLTNDHKRAHGCTMDEALALAPDEIDGFDVLMERYLATVGRFGERCWGYIEVDQGGRENKIRTRAVLESKGLRPIPVYHPLNDGWDYFDDLASSYDRICLGNVVQADTRTRVRIIAAVLSRRAKYPDLWIHGLGMSPETPVPMSLPLDSMDASSWLRPNRFNRWQVTAAMTKAAVMPDGFYYRLDANHDATDGIRWATNLLSFDVTAAQVIWRNHLAASARESSS